MRVRELRRRRRGRESSRAEREGRREAASNTRNVGHSGLWHLPEPGPGPCDAGRGQAEGHVHTRTHISCRTLHVLFCMYTRSTLKLTSMTRPFLDSPLRLCVQRARVRAWRHTCTTHLASTPDTCRNANQSPQNYPARTPKSKCQTY